MCRTKCISLHNVSWKDSKWLHWISQLSSVCKNPCINMEHLDSLDFYNNFLSAFKKILYLYLLYFLIMLLWSSFNLLGCKYYFIELSLNPESGYIYSYIWIYVDFVHFCTDFVSFIFITVSNMEHKCTVLNMLHIPSFG